MTKKSRNKHTPAFKAKVALAAIKEVDMTRIIVAHRPETIRPADRVIALDKGKVVNDLQVLADKAELPPAVTGLLDGDSSSLGSAERLSLIRRQEAILRCHTYGGSKVVSSCPAMLISVAAFALGVVILTEAAAAETFVLNNGETVEGSVVQSTLNDTVVKREDFGLDRYRHDDIDQVIIATPRGPIAGSWIGWADGVYALKVRDRVVRVQDGKIIGTGLGTPPIGRGAPAVADHVILDAPTPMPGRDSEDSIDPINITGTADAAREDEGTLVYNLSLSRHHAEPIVLIFATIAGTARPDVDFLTTSGIIIIEPGVTTLQLEITLLDDDVAEGEEQFEVYLTIDPKLANLETRSLVATILDDDS